METDLKKYEAFFKYKDSLYFEKALLNNYLNNTLIIPEESLEKKDKIFLGKLTELTKLNLDEFKKIIGVANFYNIQSVLYSVNTALINLLNKNQDSKNYIQNLIQKSVKDNLFVDLNQEKVKQILSLFSEILCISYLMAGRKSFIMSGDKFKFEYRTSGPFDLVFRNEKDNLLYFFDVKRITLDSPISDIDEKKIKQKIAEKIIEVCKKVHPISRPIFLMLDCSELSVTEKIVSTDEKSGLPVFEFFCNTKRIKAILESFFEENKGVMEELEYIAGVGLFYWFLGLCKKEGKMGFDLGIMFWYQPYTNLDSLFKKENDKLIEINNILDKELEKEKNKVLSELADYGSFKVISPNMGSVKE